MRLYIGNSWIKIIQIYQFKIQNFHHHFHSALLQQKMQVEKFNQKMQVDQLTSENRQSKRLMTELDSNRKNFTLTPPSTVSINHNISYKNPNHESLTEDHFFKTLNSDISLPKIRPDSSQIQKWQNQYSHQSASKSLNRTYLARQSSDDMKSFFSRVFPQNKLNKDKMIQFQQKPKGVETQLDTNLLKFDNELLKKQNQKLNQTVQKLRKELDEKVSTLRKFNQLMKIKYTQLKELKASLQQKQILVKNLQLKCSTAIDLQQATQLKQLLIRKNNELHQINAKINNFQHENFKNEVFQNKIYKLYQQLDQQKSKVNQHLLQKSVTTQKIKEMQEQVAILQFEKQKIKILGKVAEIQQIQNLFKNPQSSPTKNNKQSTHLTAFQQALRVQMKQIEQLKQVIDNSSEVVQKLRDNLVSSRRQLQELRGQMRILDLKASSERKKLIMEYILQIHEKDNEINSSLKKWKTLEQKYKNALMQIKTKDDFFKQYLLGRTIEAFAQDSIQTILKQYTEDFDSLISLKTQNQFLKEKLQKYQKFEEEIYIF